jgi:hypothetical protein
MKRLLFLLLLASIALGQETNWMPGYMVTPAGDWWYQSYTCCFANGGDTYEITIYTPSDGNVFSYAQGTTNTLGETYTNWNQSLSYWINYCNTGGCSGDWSAFVVVGTDAKFPVQIQASWPTVPFNKFVYSHYNYAGCNPNCPP